ncbi:MAG: hypothetical protein NTW19_21380 [Planctomycetota bacterium]|nr:hypothetical protein [Planctomycetota bacterium]
MADDKENKPEPGSALEDLESQLDSLLAKINEQTDEAASARPAPEASPAAPPVEPAAIIAKAVPAAAASKTDTDSDAIPEADFTAPDLTAEDLAGDDLAQQIQELLDDARDAAETANSAAPAGPVAAAPAKPAPAAAKSAPAQPAPAPTPAAAKSAPAPTDDDLSLEGTFEAPVVDDLDPDAVVEGPAVKIGAALAEKPAPPIVMKAPPAVAPPAAKTAPAAEPAPEAKPPVVERKIKQIDAELAAGADDMIAGDFETPEQALAAENGGVPDPLAQMAASAEREQRAAEAAQESAVTEPSTPDAVQHAAEGEEEIELDGAFSSPEDLLATDGQAAAPGSEPTAANASAEPALSPSAQAVARELDEQPEHAGRHLVPRPAPQKLPAESGPIGPITPRIPWSTRIRHAVTKLALRIIAIGPDTIRGTLALINRPVMRMSAANRDLVGWAGLITLLPAVVLIAWVAAFGPPPPREPEPPAPAAAHEGGHESSAAKPKAEGHAAPAHGAPAKEKAAGGHAAPPKEKAHGSAAKDKHGAQASAHGEH